jgi:hypothetical protein
MNNKKIKIKKTKTKNKGRLVSKEGKLGCGSESQRQVPKGRNFQSQFSGGRGELLTSRSLTFSKFHFLIYKMVNPTSQCCPGD